MEETLQKPSIAEGEVIKIIEIKLKREYFELVNYTLEMLGEWIGLCGDHALLNVEIRLEEGKETTKTYNFFVKLYPRVPFVIEFIEGTGAFRKEISVYESFETMKEAEIKILEDCVPRCYLTVPNEFLILDNLTDEGYSSVSRHQIFDYDTIRVVLEALAKLHASTLIHEEKTSVRLGENLEETYFSERYNFPNREGLDAAFTGILNSIELFDFPEKLLSGKKFREVLRDVLNRVYKLARPSETFRNVISHGDIWATNVLIKRDESGKAVRCKLVDFQCGRYTPPAQDIMAVIHLTTSREFRKKYMYNLIGIYYTDLEKHVTLAGYNMKKIIPFDDFLASCEEQKAFGLIQTAIYFPLILLNSKTVEEYFGNKGANKEALLVDRSILIKQHMDNDENYKNRIKDSIQDLKDYCDYL